MELADAATVVACGPGLGRSPELDELVVRLYRELPGRWSSMPTR